jgi:hypothetical protein
LLAVHHLRNGREQLTAGFLVFLAGETLIVSGSAMNLAASAPLFAAGAGLWAAALGLISAAREFPVLVRATGAIAAVALSALLPFGAYPFLAITLLGWVWAHLRSDRRGTLRRERRTRRSNVRDSAR